MFGDLRIIIIGAGAAGIAAASRLTEKGFKNILILEASNRIGGRVHTVQFSKHVIELGAQWCHGEEKNVVYNLASSYNLLASSENISDPTKHIFVNSIGEVISEQETAEIIRIYNKILHNSKEYIHKPKTSFGQYFIKQFYNEIKNNPLITKEKSEQVLDWIHKYQNSIDCSDTWFDVSATRLKEYWECEGDPLLNWKTNGYRTIFDLLTKNFPDPKKSLPVYEKILFNKEVCLIDYRSESNVKVSTTDGSIYEASNVIFTPSLGVLKERCLQLFEPSLSASRIQAIKGFGIGVANKIFLEFPYRWWPKNTGSFSFMWSDNKKKDFLEKYGKNRLWLCDVFIFFTVDYQPQVLSGWIVGPNAKYMEMLSNEEVLNELYFLLKMFLGHIYDIPKPSAIIRSNWFSDKYFRGSYSYRNIQTEKLNINYRDLADPIETSTKKPIVLFAGEATHEHYYSTVHGAIETGFREADRLINFYRNLKPHF